VAALPGPVAGGAARRPGAQRTAGLLCIHRQTLYYRLGRIEDLTGRLMTAARSREDDAVVRLDLQDRSARPDSAVGRCRLSGR
jgi:hypothetical protein